ncbi:OmpA family protein [Variovorax paradoxus]|nr:OmpA family protein [Variovorax paradoxus]
MNTKRMLPLLSAAAISSLAGAGALAQDNGYYYGGLSVGQSRAKIDDERIAAGLLGAGLGTTSLSLNERGTAFKLFGGYQFNRYFALEGGYFDLGKFGYAATTWPTGTLDGQIKLRGFNLDLVGTLPITERFSVIGRVGAQVAKASDRFSGTGAVQVLTPNPSKRDTNYKVGLGIQYEVTPSFLIRGEAERYRINDAIGNRGDVNTFSVTLMFPFGRAVAPASHPVVTSSYVAPPPTTEPPPPPVQVVPAPARKRVSFSADSLFAFDAATLRPEGRDALDRFMKDLGGLRFDAVHIEGHTDRLGSAAYNQRLSMRRAQTVRQYFIAQGRFEPAKLVATGKGENAPVTLPGDCKGSAPTPTLIACLQPDRRVVVEVSGATD